MPAQHDEAAPPAAALTPTDEEFKIGEPSTGSPLRARLYHDAPTTPGGLEAYYGKQAYDNPVGGRQRKDSKPDLSGRNKWTGCCIAKICGGLCCFTLLLALGFVLFFWVFAYRPCPAMKGVQLISAPKPTMHNLFTDMAGVSDDQVDRKLGEAWEAIFRGVPKHRGCYQPSYFELDDGSAHVLNTESGYVTSEGMSYGMMIAAQMERQEEFNRLWRFTKKYMQHKDGPWKGMIAWKAGPDGEVMDANSAPDGDIYIAAALLVAHGHWGEAGYLYDARAILEALADPKTGVLTTEGKVVFAVYERERSNPSYHLPGFFEMFARVYKREGWIGDVVWAQAAIASRAFLKKATDPKTGLAPDFTNIDGTPWTLGDGNDNFQWDAWRVGANIAFDWAWWGKDEWAREHADMLQAFFASKGLKSYTSLYTLDGNAVLDKRGARDHNAGLVAMNAVTSLAATDRPRASAFVKELWRTRLPTSGEWRYYPSMLYFLGLLHASGRFKPVQGLGHQEPPTAPAT